MLRISAATAVACLAVNTSLDAQTALTLQDALARARAQAGVVAVARARIAEAGAAVVAASARFRDNPILETSAGPRAGAGNRSTDVDIGFSQAFETGGQRSARIAAAEASVDRARADADAAARLVVFDVATAFLSGVAAGERLRLAEQAEAVSRDLLAATERRYSAGDVAAIDLNLARIEAARHASAVAGARADLIGALGTLTALLRLPVGEPLELRGTLDVVALPPLATLEWTVGHRPEFAALAAEARSAEADVRLGRALARPDLGVRVGYEREETDTVVFGGLTVTLPAFQRGQGTLAAGRARASRAGVELETARQIAIAELQAAYAVAGQRNALAETLGEQTTATLADNESLSRRSYEAGETNLMDYLLIRRNALETRALIIERRLEAARSRLEVDFIAGVIR
jgi:cobalt-zinc-cadmium efflux system outer membrane protein